jgi:hypothetical protein
MKIFTGKGFTFKESPKIISISTISDVGPCNSVVFESLPAILHITGPNSGMFDASGWSDGGSSCNGVSATFSDNESGIWSIPPGYCIKGNLTSSPPVTIVP